MANKLDIKDDPPQQQWGEQNLDIIQGLGACHMLRVHVAAILATRPPVKSYMEKMKERAMKAGYMDVWAWHSTGPATRCCAWEILFIVPGVVVFWRLVLKPIGAGVWKGCGKLEVSPRFAPQA